MSTVQLDLLAAREARDEGLERVLERKSAFRWKVENAIWELAQTGSPFHSDMVRQMVGECPPGVSTNLVGALFIAASKAKLIRAVGWTTSARVIGHANSVRLWQGVRS